MSVGILLVDDHAILVNGLRALIEKTANLNVVGEAFDGRRAVELAGELRPDIVIMDITLPNLNGIEATRCIIRENPQVKVIALSMHCKKRFVAGMFKSGARGYILKNSVFEELFLAIESVLNGEYYLSPKVTTLLLEKFVDFLSTANSTLLSNLTDRELQILQNLAEGKTNKEIASSLQVSVKTADSDRRHLMQKLNVDNIAELVKIAIREELTPL